MVKNKAQAGIIAIVLILLIAIIGVSIVWQVVRRNVEKSEEIDIETIIADFKIKNIFINKSSEKLQLIIQRGPDNLKLSLIKVIVLANNQEKYTITNYPKSLESKTYVLNISSLENLKEVLVYPVSEKGKIGIGEKYEITGNELEEINNDLEVINPDEDREECIPNWECEAWTDCQAVYDLESVIGEEVFLEGEQIRNCEDKNNCLEPVIERKECDPSVSIKVKKVESCSKEYLEIYDLDDVLISRLELVDGKLNIQFPLDKQEYFPYCYNEVQDSDCDETGIDCGGSCPDC